MHVVRQEVLLISESSLPDIQYVDAMWCLWLLLLLQPGSKKSFYCVSKILFAKGKEMQEAVRKTLPAVPNNAFVCRQHSGDLPFVVWFMPHKL